MTLSLEVSTTSHLDSLCQALEESGFRDQSWLATERKLVDHWLDHFLTGKPGETLELEYDPLQSRFLDKALVVLRETLDGAQFLSAWQSWILLRRDFEVKEFARGLTARADEFAQGLAREMDTIFPAEDRSQLPDREKLEEALVCFARSWAAAAEDQSAARSAWEAIRQFHLQVTRRLRAPLQYWQILVARMDLQASERMRAGRAHPWKTAFRVIEETLFFQNAIRRFYDVLEEACEDGATYAWLPVCAALRAGPGVLWERLTLRAELAWFGQVESPPPELGEGAEWRRLLRREVERSDLDFLDSGRAWLASLLTAPERVEEILVLADEPLVVLAESLSQGMKGTDAAPRMRKNLRFLLREAIWAGILADSGLPSRVNFLTRVVEFGGLDLGVDAWRKLTQMVASLRKLVADTPALSGVGSIDWLLAELDDHRKSLQALGVYEKEGLPHFIKWLNSKVAGSERRTLIQRIEERVRVDLRLLGVDRAAGGTLGWLTREELPFLDNLPDDSLAALLSEGAHIMEAGTRGGTAASRVLSSVASGSERATAGFRLLEGGWEIGDEVAGEVFRLLPDYAAAVGENGRQSCQRDNALTLGKVAELLLDGTDNAGEQLNEWWSSLVGSYVATRPQSLFNVTLNALYGSLTRHLSAPEAVLAFAPIQFVYRESLGIECRAAKAAVVPKPLGRLGRSLLEGRPGFQTLFFLEEGEDSGSAAVSTDARLLFRSLMAEVNARGDIELAARPFLAELRKQIAVHGAAAVVRETLLYAHSLVADEGLMRWPALETARVWVEIIEQVAFGLLLEAHREEVAGYFGEAMIHYMPDHFAHLPREAAVAKCQRDQRILLSNWTRWLSRETPSAAWLAGFRYYLEMLLPFVEYPAVIWQMSARTIEKFLCTRADAAEYGGLCRFVAQMEKMSHGLAEASNVSRQFFDLEDYTFSPDSTEESASRSLLSAAMACAAAGLDAPADAHNIAVHFVLSDALGDRASADSVARLAEKVRKALGDHLRPAVVRQLDLIQNIAAQASALASAEITSLAAVRALRPCGSRSDGFWKALFVASCTDPEAHAVAARDNAFLLGQGTGECPSGDSAESIFSSWMSAVEALPAEDSGDCTKVAWSGLLSSVLFPITPASPLHASAFAHDLAGRLAQAGRYLEAHLTVPPVSPPEALMEALGSIVPLAAQWSLLRHITGEVAAAATLETGAGQSTGTLLDRLESGRSGPYSQLPAGQHCDRTTNERAFEFVFRRLGRSGADLPAHPPKVFLGDPLENYTRFDGNVVNNAYAQITRQLMEEAGSPAGRVRAATALAAMALRETPLKGPLWGELTSLRTLTEGAFFGRFEAAIPDLVEKACAAPALRAKAPSLSPVLTAQLGLFTRTFAQSGDFEAAVEAFKGVVGDDLSDLDGSLFTEAYESLSLETSAALPSGEALFWSYVLERLAESMREVLLGAALLEQLDAISEELAGALGASGSDESASFAMRRDIRLYLLMLAGTLCRQSRTRGSLNTLRFVLETGLSGKRMHALQATGAIARLEILLSRSLSPKLKPVANQLFGFWGHVFSQTAWMGRFWKEAAPAAVEALVHLGHTRDVAIDFLSGFLGSAIAPNEGSFTGARALLVRHALGHPAFGKGAGSALPEVLDGLRSAWENAGITLPGSVGRRLIELPPLIELIGQCGAKKSSTFLRFVTLMGKERSGRPLWRASLFARLDTSSGYFETDPLDPLAAREAGLELPDDRLLQTQVRLHGSLRSLRDLRVEAPPPAPAGGLMGLFKKPPVAQTPPGWSDLRLRLHVQRAVSGVMWMDILADSANSPALSEPLSQKGLRAYDLSEEASEELFWQSLQAAAEREFGEGHGLSSTLRTLVPHCRRRRFSEALGEAGGGRHAALFHFIALLLLGERSLAEATLYGGEGGEAPGDLLRRSLEILEKPENATLHPVAAEIRQLARQA